MAPLSKHTALTPALLPCLLPANSRRRGNHLDVVKFLIARGADPNAQNGYGNKPVDEADEQPVIDYLKSL